MNVTLTIPDAIATSVIDNVCAATNWTQATGQTKAQWAKAQLISYVGRLNQTGAQKLAAAAADAVTRANPIS